MDAEKHDREFETLTRFVSVFCRDHHGTDGRTVCPECTDLLSYARSRLDKCPNDPKPKCKDCKTHCYRPQYRQRVKKVMRYSGMHFVKRGRIDWLVKYFM
ncbi:MAG: nitrous oxide-stimulated promoter family protein [Deltaproteobacteria bacterium]|nr:nitrous oxide-stimulated promoter family protein [Deltaproteobacteria bacterium]